MSRPETRLNARPAPAKVECCIDSACESGLRNQYFEGKRLTPDSFRVEQSYQVERRRLLNRAIHGWGVVYGYAIRPRPSGRLTIGPGLALDQSGRELVQTDSVEQSFDQVIVLDDQGRPVASSGASGYVATGYARQDPGPSAERSDAEFRECWLLSVHYAEQDVGPVTIKDPCHCERHQWDHVCETVRYSLRRIDCEQCCDDAPCELGCRCTTGPCCERHQEREGEPCAPFTRGGCQCLCEDLTRLHPGAEGGRLYEIEEPCGRVRVDLRHGVRLACITLVKDECDRWTFGTEVDGCGPRRLVKRNDLLFDLVRGCDLTRISQIGWVRWHRLSSLVPWNQFEASFGTPSDTGQNATTDYWVEFSRPVRADTVRADCFAITILTTEGREGWWEPHRVPILDVVTAGPDLTAGLVTKATVVVDSNWIRDAIIGRWNLFNQCSALVEIEVFGDYIVDCNGQTVDANARGLCGVPSGNGTPGDALRSTFRVEQRTTSGYASYDQSPRAQGA
jgi:hypothetical protein